MSSLPRKSSTALQPWERPIDLVCAEMVIKKELVKHGKAWAGRYNLQEMCLQKVHDYLGEKRSLFLDKLLKKLDLDTCHYGVCGNGVVNWLSKGEWAGCVDLFISPDEAKVEVEILDLVKSTSFSHKVVHEGVHPVPYVLDSIQIVDEGDVWLNVSFKTSIFAYSDWSDSPTFMSGLFKGSPDRTLIVNYWEDLRDNVIVVKQSITRERLHEIMLKGFAARYSL